MNRHSYLKISLTAVAGMLLTSSSLLAQSMDQPVTVHSGGSPIGGLIVLIVGIVVLIGMWKMFTKAGQPGWGCIIPIYNLYLLCKMAGRPGWWVLLMLIPLVNIIIAILIWLDIAKAFGKGAGFAVGLIFLSFIFIPILGFGDATYQGPPAR
jgi:uncharacterized membrane protein YhaH (DUF805 family)